MKPNAHQNKTSIFKCDGYKRWVLLLFVAVIIGVIKASVIDLNEIVSRSMAPTLKTDDLIISYKLEYGIRIPQTNYYLYRSERPAIGDVVLFEGDKFSYKNTWIKRVVAVGGDKVRVQNKKLYVNNAEMACTAKVETEKGYFCSEAQGDSVSYKVQWLNMAIKRADNVEVYTVPKDHVFLMGDNRSNSLDSRYIGAKHIDTLYGKQLVVFQGVAKLYQYIIICLIIVLFFWDKVLSIIWKPKLCPNKKPKH